MAISPKFRWLTIPRAILLDRRLKPIEQMVFTDIMWLDYKGKWQGCYATNAHFAEMFGVGTRRISQIISKLCAEGYITLQWVKGNTSRRLLRCNQHMDLSFEGGGSESTRGGQEIPF